MIVLYLVLPLALVFASIAVAAFVWSVRSGQLDDVDTPAHRILFDDDDVAERDTAKDPRASRPAAP